MNRKEIKMRAKEYAFNNKWALWKPVLTFGVITMIVSFAVGLLAGIFGLDPDGSAFNALNSLVSIASIPLTVAELLYVIKTIKGEAIDLKEIILSRYKLILPIILTSCVVGLLIGLGTIALIIPGILLALRFSQVNYVLAEGKKEDVSDLKALSTSSNLMKGHYGEYFMFHLSFIGWYLLCAVTLGIASIWVMPYVTVSQYYFYEELKKQSN